MGKRSGPNLGREWVLRRVQSRDDFDRLSGDAIDTRSTAQDRGYCIKSEILGNTDLDSLCRIADIESLAS